MIYKVLGVLIMVAAGVIMSLILKQETPCVQLTPAQQLIALINDDFHTLIREGSLPPEWNSIATIKVEMNSDLARALLGKERPRFQRVKDGSSYLELQFLDLPDEENAGIIIQASLFDIKSKNKIFEIGRTYTMDDLNKKASQSNPEAL
ncbi:MAG: hypothetical protein AAGB31_11650 [Bdellovibrio sp.]